MKLVVDTNILFSFFKESSFTHKILFESQFEFFAPEYVFIELEKYRLTVMQKAKITPAQYARLLKLLSRKVTFVKETEYASFLSRAKLISPDKKDVDFFALALSLKCPLWTLDKELQKQSTVLILTTADIVEGTFTKI